MDHNKNIQNPGQPPKKPDLRDRSPRPRKPNQPKLRATTTLPTPIECNCTLYGPKWGLHYLETSEDVKLHEAWKQRKQEEQQQKKLQALEKLQNEIRGDGPLSLNEIQFDANPNDIHPYTFKTPDPPADANVDHDSVPIQPTAWKRRKLTNTTGSGPAHSAKLVSGVDQSSERTEHPDRAVYRGPQTIEPIGRLALLQNALEEENLAHGRLSEGKFVPKGI